MHKYLMFAPFVNMSIHTENYHIIKLQYYRE